MPCVDVRLGFLVKNRTVETYDKKSYDKKSRPSIFDLWTPELNNLDLNIGFLIQNCIYIYIYISEDLSLYSDRVK